MTGKSCALCPLSLSPEYGVVTSPSRVHRIPTFMSTACTREETFAERTPQARNKFVLEVRGDPMYPCGLGTLQQNVMSMGFVPSGFTCVIPFITRA